MSYSAPFHGAMYDIGAGEGLRPFEPRPGELPPPPHHPRRSLLPLPMTEALMARKATAAGVMRGFGIVPDHSGENAAL